MPPTAQAPAAPIVHRLIFYVLLFIAVGIEFALGLSRWTLLATLFASMLVFEFFAEPWIRRTFFGKRKVRNDSKFAVACTDEEITASFEGEIKERARWEDIIIVAIRIDGELPSQRWWMVSGSGGKCWFPADSIGLDAARTAMAQRLPGFDHAAADNSASSSCGVVVVWDKAKHPARVSG